MKLQMQSILSKLIFNYCCDNWAENRSWGAEGGYILTRRVCPAAVKSSNLREASAAFALGAQVNLLPVFTAGRRFPLQAVAFRCRFIFNGCPSLVKWSIKFDSRDLGWVTTHGCFNSRRCKWRPKTWTDFLGECRERLGLGERCKLSLQ